MANRCYGKGKMMKAKELAELLLEYPEFEVRLVLATQTIGTQEDPYPKYENLKVVGIGDISYVSNQLLLEVD